VRIRRETPRNGRKLRGGQGAQQPGSQIRPINGRISNQSAQETPIAKNGGHAYCQGNTESTMQIRPGVSNAKRQMIYAKLQHLKTLKGGFLRQIQTGLDIVQATSKKPPLESKRTATCRDAAVGDSSRESRPSLIRASRVRRLQQKERETRDWSTSHQERRDYPRKNVLNGLNQDLGLGVKELDTPGKSEKRKDYKGKK